jgi:hypothetical protein
VKATSEAAAVALYFASMDLIPPTIGLAALGLWIVRGIRALASLQRQVSYG